MPIRVLLLERHCEERWWNELLGAANRYSLIESQFDSLPLFLKPLDMAGLWAVISTLAPEQTAALEVDSILAWLAEIDPLGRPLFAALSGEALAAGGKIQQWKRTDVLDDWLRRERERYWTSASVDIAHVNLAAMATFVGGIRSDVLESPPTKIALPTVNAVSPESYAAITGRRPEFLPETSWLFGPLEPDILGTHFALEHLRAPLGQEIGLPSAAIDRALAYSEAITQRSAEEWINFGEFLVRAHDDFSEHPMYVVFISQPQNEGIKWFLACADQQKKN